MRFWRNLTAAGKLLLLLLAMAVGGGAWALQAVLTNATSETPLADVEPEATAERSLGAALLAEGRPRDWLIGPLAVVSATPTPAPTVTATASPVPSPSPAATPTPVAPSPQRVDRVFVTFFDCQPDGACGVMASGQRVHRGAAACNPKLLPFGTQVRIVGWDEVLTCEDFSPALDGWYVAVWFPTEAEGEAFLAQVGRYATIEVVSFP